MKNIRSILLFTALLISQVDAFANGLLNESLATVHALNLPGSVELDAYIFKSPSYHYEGTSGVANINASSVPANESHIGVYAISSPYGNWRFALSSRPNIVDEVHTTWNDPIVAETVRTYNIDYQYITPQVSYQIFPNLFASLGINAVKARASTSASKSLYYEVIMNGEDSAYSYTAGLAYWVKEWLLLSLNGTTKTSFNLKGEVSATLGGTPINSSGQVETIVPAEYALNSLIVIDPTTYINFSYKKRFWSDCKTFDLQINNPVLEATFGVPSPRAPSDTEIYRLGFGKKLDNHNLNIFGGWNRGGVNLSTAVFSTPPSKYHFFGADYRYDFSKEWSIGGKYTYVQYLNQHVDTPVLQGDFMKTSSKYTTIYIQKRF
jgi:long-subunit fatty acid transport protein